MRAFFDGGPLDGRDDYEVPPDQTEIVCLEYAEPRIDPAAPDPTSMLPVIEHVYWRRNDVGVAGHFTYRGTR